ncbi:MAG: hypothetical protein ACREVL_04045, partial [Solimonas sp.]
MAIDELLSQADPAQRAARAASRATQGPRPLDIAQVQRMRAADAAAMNRVLAPSAAAPAQAPALDAPPPEPVAAGAADGASAASRLSRVRSMVNGGAGKLVTGLAVANSIGDAAQPDSTDRYAQRFGVSPVTGDGSAGDLAKYVGLRAGGFASDLGNNLLLGLPQQYLYRDGPR